MSAPKKPFGRRPRPGETPAASWNLWQHLEQLLATPRGRYAKGLAIGAAIGLVLFAFNSLAMRLAGRAVSSKLDAHYQPVTTGSTIGLAGDLLDLVKECKTRGSAARFGITDEHDEIGLNTDIQTAEWRLFQTATFVRCLSETQPQRFCRSEDRLHLTGEIEAYFRQMEGARASWQFSNPAAVRARATYDQARRALVASLPSSRTDAALVASLKTRIAEGYLKKSDLGGWFGFGIPGDLDALLTEGGSRAACK